MPRPYTGRPNRALRFFSQMLLTAAVRKIIFRSTPPHEGALRDRHDAGAEGGGRGRAQRRTPAPWRPKPRWSRTAGRRAQVVDRNGVSTRGHAEQASNTARGTPQAFGRSVVTCSCALFVKRTRGRGLAKARRSARPLHKRARECSKARGQTAPRDRERLSDIQIAMFLMPARHVSFFRPNDVGNYVHKKDIR
jgi:hypothetical protein